MLKIFEKTKQYFKEPLIWKISVLTCISGIAVITIVASLLNKSWTTSQMKMLQGWGNHRSKFLDAFNKAPLNKREEMVFRFVELLQIDEQLFLRSIETNEVPSLQARGILILSGLAAISVILMKEGKRDKEKTNLPDSTAAADNCELTVVSK
jgi:hypothetical protein